MKKISLALGLAAASLFSTAAMAQSSYISAGAGFSHMNVDCSNAISCDRNDLAAKALLGYGFGNGFALEFGYISFGKFSAAEPTSLGIISGDIKAHGFTLGGAYWLPLNKSIDLGLRLGASRLKTKVTAQGGGGSGSVSDTSTKPYVGLGLGYAIDQYLKVEASLDFHRGEIQGSTYNARAITVGARYAF